MAKAVLVIEMPNDVNMDRVIQTPVTLSFSLGGIKQLMFADGYLKPLPQALSVNEDEDDVSKAIGTGWNACLEEITENAEKVYKDDLYENWMFFDKGETE